MPQFVYKARNSKGQIREGKISTESKSTAKQRLKKMQLKVISLTASKAGSNDIFQERPILGKFIYYDSDNNIQIALGSTAPTGKDLIIFTKQFATMLTSGVALIQSIEILKKQQKSKTLAQALNKIQRSVEQGSSLADALSEFPDIFDKLFVAMVRAGEKSGNLDTILLKLVTYIERSDTVKSQIKSALAYPIGVMFLAILIVSGLLMFVVPTFAQQFTDAGKELPGLTQFVVDLSDFLGANWSYILGSFTVLTILFFRWVKTPRGKEIFDDKVLKLPYFGTLLKKIAVGRFCSTMASMLTAGVNLIEALTICAASSGNKTIEHFVLNVRKSLEKGEKFSEPLAEGNLIPDMVVSMVAVGESTGALDEMLVKVSDFYEEEVDRAIETMLALIEPTMIVFIGGIVGFIVIAMYLPVFEMAGAVG